MKHPKTVHPTYVFIHRGWLNFLCFQTLKTRIAQRLPIDLRLVYSKKWNINKPRYFFFICCFLCFSTKLMVSTTHHWNESFLICYNILLIDFDEQPPWVHTRSLLWRYHRINPDIHPHVHPHIHHRGFTTTSKKWEANTRFTLTRSNNISFRTKTKKTVLFASKKT